MHNFNRHPGGLFMTDLQIRKYLNLEFHEIKIKIRNLRK